jgi:hypothetical protein
MNTWEIIIWGIILYVAIVFMAWFIDIMIIKKKIKEIENEVKFKLIKP